MYEGMDLTCCFSFGLKPRGKFLVVSFMFYETNKNSETTSGENECWLVRATAVSMCWVEISQCAVEIQILLLQD